MKTQLLSTALILALSGPVFAGGTHGDAHAEMKTAMNAMTVGMPGMAENVTRTIEVSMYETDDGEMLFKPNSLDIKAGETVRFAIQNNGEFEHEFVLDTIEKNNMHKISMQKFAGMEHDDPNAIRLEEGQSGEIIWSFTNAGTFEFACLIPGHYEAGMHSAIQVSDAGDVVAADYTKGVVKKINLKTGKVTIIHEALTNLGMPAMTMVFRVSESTMLERMNVGDNIEFVAKRLKGKLVVSDLK